MVIVTEPSLLKLAAAFAIAMAIYAGPAISVYAELYRGVIGASPS